MAMYVQHLLSSLIPAECLKNLSSGDISNVECLKIITSKILGSGIVAASTLVKVPQILKLYHAKSSEGISFYGVLLELISMTATTSYSFNKKFPFSAWGDSLFLMLETATIAYLVLYYGKNYHKIVAFTSSYSLILYLFMSGLTPIRILWTCQAFSLPITVSGKLLQALVNYKNGHTGHLSAVSMVLLFLGGLARIFTSIQETGDSLMIVTFCVAASANLLLVLQIFYYWAATQRFLEGKTD